MSRLLRMLVIGTVGLPLPQVTAAPTASTLFETLRPRVYQVRVVDVASGDKTAIGSGFRIDPGLVATNFHVVSLKIHEPAKYRLELVGDDGIARRATIAGIDVLHDLAIIGDERRDERHFTLVPEVIEQGARLFSMGNPHDFGMTIVEGNYNGLIKSSRFERLLFSGSLNPGMSGGPAFDRAGTIVGVNVATGGEQISFLVPVRHLRELLDQVRHKPPPQDFKTALGQTLIADAEEFYGKRIEESWRLERFGDLMLPRDLSPSMKCWGHNIDNDEKTYEGFHQHCRSEEYLYIEDDFYTGDFSYSYEWMTTTQLNPFQFYSAVTKRFTHSSLNNVNDEEQVGNHRCTTEFVELDSQPWKASICLRRYKQYPGLHDASMVLVSLHANDRAAVIRMAATGIAQKSALGLFSKLMHSITWAR